MIKQDNLNRADEVRSHMAPILPLSPALPGGVDPVSRLLRPYAELLALPVPDPMRALVETWDRDARPLPREP